MKVSFTRNWSSTARKKFSLGYEKNFLITMIALVFVILKHSLQWRGEFRLYFGRVPEFLLVNSAAKRFSMAACFEGKFLSRFLYWCFHRPYLVVQVYELITCVRRANENAGNLISVVQFSIIHDILHDEYLSGWVFVLRQTGSSWTVNSCFLLYNLRNEQKEREVARGETNAFVPRASKVGRGLSPFLVLEKNSRIWFGRCGKSCDPYPSGWLTKCGVSFAFIGKWIGKCIDLYNARHPVNRIEQMFWSSIQFNSVLFHSHRILGTGHYYIITLMTTWQVREPSVKEIEKDLGENFRPVLRSSKKKREMSWWGQVQTGMLYLHTWKWWCPMTVILFWKRKHHWWLERSHVAMSHKH